MGSKSITEAVCGTGGTVSGTGTASTIRIWVESSSTACTLGGCRRITGNTLRSVSAEHACIASGVEVIATRAVSTGRPRAGQTVGRTVIYTGSLVGIGSILRKTLATSIDVSSSADQTVGHIADHTRTVVESEGRNASRASSVRVASRAGRGTKDAIIVNPGISTGTYETDVVGRTSLTVLHITGDTVGVTGNGSGDETWRAYSAYIASLAAHTAIDRTS